MFVQCKSTSLINQPKSPNIVLIIVDDLGYSDLSCYGSEIRTKNIDKLASQGIRFTNFYGAPNCSPTRAMLMTGMDHHQAGIGAMNGLIGPNQKGQFGYEGYLNKSTVSFSELLKDKGYRTYYTGKWHLGINEIAHPNARGFDKAWWQSGGTPASHFDCSVIRQKPNYYENDVAQYDVPNEFYSTSFYTDQLISYLSADENVGQPFLGVLSFSAVHYPIQCPDSHIDLYKGVYIEGYEKLRNQRLQKQKEIGLIAESVGLSALPSIVQPWSELTSEEQLYFIRRMEVYAGMVHNVDDNVGKLVAYLKRTEQYDNTLIILMSDNGGAGFNGWQSKAGQKRYDNAGNSLENLGRKGSVEYIGAGWGSVTTTPFRLFKRHIAEGGLRIPVIISGGYVRAKNKKNDSKKGTINHHLFTVRDIAPTIQEIGQATYPDGKYKNRNILPQTGISISELLTQDPTLSVHPNDEIFGWELFKRKAVQKEGWKILWTEPDFGKGDWELYNLQIDPSETTDLASVYPEKLSELIQAWEQYERENNVIISDGDIFFP